MHQKGNQLPMKRALQIPLFSAAAGLIALSCSTTRNSGDTTFDSIGVTGVDTGDSADTGPRFDVDDGNGGCGDVDIGCTDKIDMLFVIDNSGTMGEEQLNLAKNFPLLIERLENLTDSAGTPVMPDVNIMVTTSDFGNPLCTPFQRRDPEKGAPVFTGVQRTYRPVHRLGESSRGGGRGLHGGLPQRDGCDTIQSLHQFLAGWKQCSRGTARGRKRRWR